MTLKLQPNENLKKGETKTKRESDDMTNGRNLTVVGQRNEPRTDREQKAQTHDWGRRQPAYEWVEKGDEWGSPVASVSSGGMPYRNTHEGPAKGLKKPAF